ncbi:MAG: hypothetical protein NTY86_08210 [Deltaproteobacteria bacterium]|nr:hypothetical protein [Deltaproteobacteria bacterium]
MKKRSDAYPFYDNDDDIDPSPIITLGDPPFDDLLTTDRLDIDHLRRKMNDLLMDCDQECGMIKEYGLGNVNGFFMIRHALECKLRKVGFEDKYIKDARCLYDLIFAIKNEQWGHYTGRPPYGFPSDTYTVSDDKGQMWIREDIEAALLVLYSFRKLEELIGKDGKVNYDAAKASILTFLIMLDSARTGSSRKVALSGKKIKRINTDKRGKREKWGGLTQDQRLERNNKIFDDFKKECHNNPHARAGTTKDENGVVAIKGESR